MGASIRWHVCFFVASKEGDSFYVKEGRGDKQACDVSKCIGIDDDSLEGPSSHMLSSWKIPSEQWSVKSYET